jgi:hypothetical protein
MHSIPPDEETYALGKQTGRVFLSMYFSSTHHARDRNEWKKQGTVIMDAFLENDADNAGRLSSGFFYGIVNDPRLLLVENQEYGPVTAATTTTTTTTTDREKEEEEDAHTMISTLVASMYDSIE